MDSIALPICLFLIALVIIGAIVVNKLTDIQRSLDEIKKKQ